LFLFLEDDHHLSKIDTVARSLHCIPEADTAATHKRRKSMPIYQIVVGKNNLKVKDWRKCLFTLFIATEIS